MQFPGEDTMGERGEGPEQDGVLRAARDIEVFNCMNIKYKGTFYSGSQGYEVDLIFDTGSAVSE